MKFTPRLPIGHIDVLNFRARVQAEPCPHCHRSSAIKSHGYLWGYAASGDDTETRGLRFFLL